MCWELREFSKVAQRVQNSSDVQDIESYLMHFTTVGHWQRALAFIISINLPEQKCDQPSQPFLFLVAERLAHFLISKNLMIT
jgi:hypothetical protein